MHQLRRGPVRRLAASLGLVGALLHVVLFSLQVSAASAAEGEASLIRTIAHAWCGPARSADTSAPVTEPSETRAGSDCPLCSALAPLALASPASTLLALLRLEIAGPSPPARADCAARPEIRAEKSRGPPLSSLL
ncbi:MAG: DUF2946 family protein [Pseudomonadota bacterium]